MICQGNSVSLFFDGTQGACVSIELMQDGCLIHKQSVAVNCNGPTIIKLNDVISGGIRLRLKMADNTSILRVLEINNRKTLVFSTRSIAAFVGASAD